MKNGDGVAQTLKFINLQHYHLWDFAGVDGLQFARKLVGDRATKIAPFQSFETTLLNYSCSVLRLCEGNFRLGVQNGGAEIETTLQQHQRGFKVWVKTCRSMQAIALTDTTGLTLLPQLMTTKPPYRLEGLAENCAVPVRLNRVAMLVWRHPMSEMAVVELQTAVRDIEYVKSQLRHYCC